MNKVAKLINNDPLENSWENDKVVITSELATIARTLIIEEKIDNTKDAIMNLQNIKGLVVDKVFCDLFSVIFKIELCKYNIKHQI